MDEILTSINHKNKREIENISKKYKEAKDDAKLSIKKFANMHKMIMENRELTLKELIGEMVDREDFFFQATVLPISAFDKEENEESGKSENELEAVEG